MERKRSSEFRRIFTVAFDDLGWVRKLAPRLRYALLYSSKILLDKRWRTFAWDISLEARALCTMTWSEHQYQMEEMASPKVIPDQGRSDLPEIDIENGPVT